jgi:hypothetical protein
MGRNNADLMKGIFHGSFYPFSPGDIITPPSDSYGAYATNSPEEAATYGDVYSVEPIDPNEDLSPHSGINGTTNYESFKGFRVKKFHSPTSQRGDDSDYG